MIAPPPFGVLLHPTDLSERSERAFLHALRMALFAHGSLRVLHVRGEERHRMPSVREALVRWGFARDGAAPEDVSRLGVDVVKVEVRGEPVAAAVRDAERHDPDLIVLATRGMDGLARLFSRSVAEPLARALKRPVLLFSPDARGFVAADGRIHVERILVPIDERTSPGLGIEGAARLARLGTNVVIRLLHVGPEMPDVNVYEHEGWTWERETRVGAGVLRTIVDEARAWGADAIVMATAGHDSAGDAVFGSTTEQVGREAPCPVLWMPVGLDEAD